jgi:hypothetical protein
MGQLNEFGTSSWNDRYLREADGWSRCEAGITGRHTVKNASEGKRS